MRIARNIRRYDSAFREGALALVERSDKSIAEVAKTLGMPSQTLYKWSSDHMAKKAKKGPDGKPPSDSHAAETDAEKIARLEAELAAALKKVASLEEDKDILKKFAAFSVREKT